MLDPEGTVDDQYLVNVSGLLKNMINEVDDEIDSQQNSLFEAEELLQDTVNKLRSHMSQHNQLTSDIRALLKNMLKSDGDKVTGLKEYLSRYKRFLEVISAISSAMYDKENVFNSIHAVNGQVQEAQELIGGVFDDIFSFEADNGKSNNKRPPLLRQSSVQSINGVKEKTPRCKYIFLILLPVLAFKSFLNILIIPVGSTKNNLVLKVCIMFYFTWTMALLFHTFQI